MQIQFNETLKIHDLQQCAKQDLDDISELIGGTRSFMEMAKRGKKRAKFASVFCHTFAVLDGAWVILCSQYGHVDKFTLAMCLFIVLYCGKNGFDFNKISQQKKTEQNEICEQYNKIKNIIENVPASQIHKIAEIYRAQCPNQNNITLDDLKKAICHIAVRYER